MVPADEINSHSKSHANWKECYGGPGQPTSSYAKRTVQWSDAEVFLGLAVHIPSISCLDVGDGTSINLVNMIRFQLVRPASNTPLAKTFYYRQLDEKIVSLAYCASNMNGSLRGGYNNLADELTFRCPSIEDVSIRVPSTVSDPYKFGANPLLRACRHLRKLKTFQVVAADASPSVI